MSSSRRLLAAIALLAAAATQAAPRDAAFPGIGRAATPKELAAWDIDVRPDLEGLPAGSGSVAKGQEVWESKCASCHGVFGESGEVFNPIVGGTAKEDIRTGRVARLTDRGYPGRTTLMKLSTISTLWDYIHRAMPWNAPKSLSTDEVYAATAYILNLGGIVPDDFVLSEKNMAEVQQRLPNRNGMTTEHALWPGREFGKRAPDVHATACMHDCATEAKVGSLLPDFARNAHGNLAQQNRLVGAQRGADTTHPDAGSPQANAADLARLAAAPAASAPSANGTSSTVPAAGGAPTTLLEKNGCVACHANDRKLVGPAFAEVARKYAGRADAASYLAGKIKSGGSGAWGAIPMPAQTLPEPDTRAIAQWLSEGAKH